jgi:hypothetical protein
MELKLSAYVDYINSIAQVKFLNTSERSKALDQVVAAKTKALHQTAIALCTLAAR